MAALLGLFAASFAAATLVPLPSEAALYAYLQAYPDRAVLAWLPGVGDALCVAAGWLRINAIAVLAFMAAGRLARYIAVAALA